MSWSVTVRPLIQAAISLGVLLDQTSALEYTVLVYATSRGCAKRHPTSPSILSLLCVYSLRPLDYLAQLEEENDGDDLCE